MIRLLHVIFRHTLPEPFWTRWCMWRAQHERVKAWAGSTAPLPQKKPVTVEQLWDEEANRRASAQSKLLDARARAERDVKTYQQALDNFERELQRQRGVPADQRCHHCNRIHQQHVKQRIGDAMVDLECETAKLKDEIEKHRIWLGQF